MFSPTIEPVPKALVPTGGDTLGINIVGSTDPGPLYGIEPFMSAIDGIVIDIEYISILKK